MDSIIWSFTINNPVSADWRPLTIDRRMCYVIFGFEAYDRNTPHIQGVVVFHEPVSFSYLKRLCRRGHFEISKKELSVNIRYCKKEHVYTEHGDLFKALNLDRNQRSGDGPVLVKPVSPVKKLTLTPFSSEGFDPEYGSYLVDPSY